MNQNYRSKVEIPIGFKSILLRIASGERVDTNELLPYLCLEARAQRCEVNALLADAYFQAKTVGSLDQAKIFVQRAWLLSESQGDLFPLYLEVFSRLKDTEGIRAAYKRLGMLAAERGNISEAIQNFNSWHTAYGLYDNLDRYEYDFDILAAMAALAIPHCFIHPPDAAIPRNGERIRLAYLVEGITHLNSILVRINLEFAKLHDKTRFDVTFFIADSTDVIAKSPQGTDSVRMFENFGCKIVTVSNLGNTEKVLLEVARRIYDFKPHILIMSAALARFEHYFIASVRPAPMVIGLVQGPPQQFAPPILDWAIAWSKHPLMDTPVNCSLVQLTLQWEELDDVRPYRRAQLGLPDSACILLSGGRPSKFEDKNHWKAIVDLLADHPEAYYVVVGASKEELPFLDALLPMEIKPRVRCMGWRADVLEILGCADIVIDTYPNGGGQILVQALSMRLPIIAHQNDYLKLFDQTNWSPVEDFISDSEVVVPRGDFQAFKQVISRLIDEKAYRTTIAERSREKLLQLSEKSGVRECEEIYLKVLQLHSAPTPSADAAEVNRS